MEYERASGVLLHPTSFPGPYGIGDLGAEAYRFVDFLAQTGQKLWQILPLAPTGYGDSPYAAFSAFAGNPLLISPDLLREQNLLTGEDLQDLPTFSASKIEFGPLIEWKMALLRHSFEHFKQAANDQFKAELAQFEQNNAEWLEDFALFMAVKQAHGGITWSDWETDIVLRRPAALSEWREKEADEIAFQKYNQFLFFRQWFNLKQYANERNIKVIGDVPIFVAYDSADVWAHPELFYLDQHGHSTLVAGVPPDYFSATGQYWGNPLYRWDVLAASGYEWWIKRFQQAFQVIDILRLDHFRGFEAFWEIPANPEQSAVNGQWVKGPGSAFFEAIQAAIGERPIIAEDLGVITPEVVAIRRAAGLPGMRVIQFAFGAFDTDATDPYLPHNFEQNIVVYTGTHDNDTTAGWFSAATQLERESVLNYLDLPPDSPISPAEIAWKMVRLAWGSVANLAIVPLQDLLGLGSEARMNTPGRADGNWGWRYQPDSLSDELRARLTNITLIFARYVRPREGASFVRTPRKIGQGGETK